LKACTRIEILKISADANFEDPLTAPLNPRLNDGRQTTSLQLIAARRPSRGLVKPDVIILVPGKTSIGWSGEGGGDRCVWACRRFTVARQRDACDSLLQRKQGQTQRVKLTCCFQYAEWPFDIRISICETDIIVYRISFNITNTNQTWFSVPLKNQAVTQCIVFVKHHSNVVWFQMSAEETTAVHTDSVGKYSAASTLICLVNENGKAKWNAAVMPAAHTQEICTRNVHEKFDASSSQFLARVRKLPV